jgi:hypothetical protein
MKNGISSSLENYFDKYADLQVISIGKIITLVQQCQVIMKGL